MTRRGAFAPIQPSSNVLPMTTDDLGPENDSHLTNGGFAPSVGSLPGDNSSSRTNLFSGGTGLSSFDTRFSSGSRSSRNNASSGRVRSGNSFSFRIPLVLRRLLRPPTLDFETAIWEILYLVISPTKVYKSLYYHKQTKNKWARDDPSFMILLSGFLVVSALGWGLAYSPGFLSVLKLMVYMVLVDFFATGVVVATFFWVIANKFLRKDGSQNLLGFGQRSMSSRARSWFLKRDNSDVMSMNSQMSSSTNNINTPGFNRRRNAPTMIGGDSGELEWAYCFDVHCNSFLVIWLILYVLQFILLPILTRDSWFCLFLGNSLYLFALCHYCVITFYGYNALPFLQHTELLLAPIPVFVVLYIFSLFGLNIAKTMGQFYFG